MTVNMKKELSPKDYMQKRFEVSLDMVKSLLTHPKYEESLLSEKTTKHFFYMCIKSSEIFLKENGYSLKKEDGTEAP